MDRAGLIMTGECFVKLQFGQVVTKFVTSLVMPIQKYLGLIIDNILKTPICAAKDVS